MGNGLWFVTILKDQPWVALVIVLVITALVFLAKRWVAKKLMGDQAADASADRPGGPSQAT
jgi:hypothetical protein